MHPLDDNYDPWVDKGIPQSGTWDQVLYAEPEPSEVTAEEMTEIHWMLWEPLSWGHEPPDMPCPCQKAALGFALAGDKRAVLTTLRYCLANHPDGEEYRHWITMHEQVGQ